MLGVCAVYRVSGPGCQCFDHGVARLVGIPIMNHDDRYITDLGACQLNDPRDIDAGDVGRAQQ